MRKLGISIYPEHTTWEKVVEYMDLASKYGFSKIFTCMLSVTSSKEETIEEFKKFNQAAHSRGFEVSVDTNDRVFNELGATANDISVFNEMGFDTVRLDSPFGDEQNISISNNPFGIKIEYNASSNMSLDLLIEKGANRINMVTCHNFYPQEYTGLGVDRFNYLTDKYYKSGLPVHAFISSNNEGTHGPWPVFNGLPTLEIFRNKPIDFQLRYLVATKKINDILIGNAFASEEEIESLSKIDLYKTTLRADLSEGITEEEKHILFNYQHSDRPDASDFIVRSSMPRMDYRETGIDHRPYEKEYFEKGDVLIVNDNLSHYRGELQIVRQAIRNTGERNLVAKLKEDDLLILDLLKAQYQFEIIE